jgi:hypothetical protein
MAQAAAAAKTDGEGAQRHWGRWDGPEPVDTESLKTREQAVRAFFSRRGPRFLRGAAAVTLGLRALFGRPRWSDAAIVAGVVAYWPFQEWVMHKYLLHAEPSVRNGKKVDPRFAQRHRAHHRHPRDLDLAMLPREVLLQGMAANALLWLLFAPTKRSAATGFAAVTTMTLIYEWTHYIVHTGVRPNNALLRRIRRNHRRHHFYNENYWHTFTFPPVDTLLGTDPHLRSVDKSPTARNLHGLDED